MSKAAVSDFKRLAGLTDEFGDWRRSAPKTESNVLNFSRAKIRRMANVLNEERIGGSILQFDEDRSERLIAESYRSPEHHKLAQHHWDARMASAQAHEVDKGGDSAASHHYHAAAAQKHHLAVQHLAAAGDHATAKVHAAWAQHHAKHAAHHAGKIASAQQQHHAAASGGHASSGEKSMVRRRPAMHRDAPAHATIHWTPETDGPAPTKPRKVKKDHPGYEGVHKSIQKHVKSAQQSTRVAVHLGKDKSASHHEVAQAHHDAAAEHLHAALALHHAGHHEHAMAHWNAAVHHKNKEREHSGAKSAHEAVAHRRANVGPRARVGRTSVRA